MLVAAGVLAMAKIVTPEVPSMIAVGFGVPLGLIFVVPYLAWDWLRGRADDLRAVVAFPALMIGAEWAQARFSPLGSWGSAAYTQVDNLALLQMASLFGTAGVSFVVYGVAAALERAWAAPRERAGWLSAAAVLAAAAHVFGLVRLSVDVAPERVVRAAAVGTDSTFGGLPVPSVEEMEKVEDAMFERTRTAAGAGASLVVWNEAATVVFRDREEALLARASEAAKSGGIHLVISYILPVTVEPLLYENKYVWLRPDGTVDHTYHKHEPVPGEPANRGIEPQQAVETGFGRASGAVCYDYDFPYLAAGHARLGAGVVAVPSSDWRGIDPIHTQMAAVRAIEGGFSIVRSTRMGLSAGIDPHGRLRGWLSSNESSDRLLIVTLPASGVVTVYSRIGDALVYVGIGYVLWAAASTLRRRREVRAAAAA